MEIGTIIAVLGAVLATILCGLGSAIAVQKAGQAATGVMSEKPDLFGKLLILQALPGTQGIYGFLAAVLLMNNIGIFSGDIAQLTTAEGWAYFGALMPITIIGFLSAIFQGKVAINSIHMTAKQPDASAKGMTMTALVETYAILALLVSILLMFGL